MNKKLQIPKTHRLAELLVYAVFGVIAAGVAFVCIQWMRGYSVMIPAMPATNVLPVPTAPGLKY